MRALSRSQKIAKEECKLVSGESWSGERQQWRTYLLEVLEISSFLSAKFRPSISCSSDADILDDRKNKFSLLEEVDDVLHAIIVKLRRTDCGSEGSAGNESRKSGICTQSVIVISLSRTSEVQTPHWCG